MKMILVLILFQFILISCSVETTKVSEPQKLVDNFFAAYKTSGPKEALNSLLLTNKYISEQVTDSVGIKLENITRKMGDFQGIEKIGEKTYGTGIVIITFVVKYSQQPIRFNFYQPGNGWRIQDFNFQTAFLNELDETVKPYRLKRILSNVPVVAY